MDPNQLNSSLVDSISRRLGIAANSLKGASKHSISGPLSNAFAILALLDWPLLNMLTGFSMNLSNSKSSQAPTTALQRLSQRAGEALDGAREQAGPKIEEAKQEIKSKSEEAKGKAKDAAKQIEQKVRQV